MSTGAVLAIVIPVLVVLAAVVLFTTSRRRDADRLGQLSGETRSRDRGAARTTEATESGPTGREVERSVALARREPGSLERAREATVEPWTPPDPEVIGVNRRQFFNRSMVGLTLLGTAGFGAASLAFLWPKVSGGFGSVIRVGTVGDVQDAIGGAQPAPNFSYWPPARAYINNYPADSLDRARTIYDANIVAGMEAGFVALYQKCPHLGCRVPPCATSQWFECPCHGSQYNRVGEKQAGPAPRGMDRFPITITADGFVEIDTGTVVTGPAIGTDTIGQGAEGPHCVGGGH
jgi:cytochrome b6-f complex iron-sulfur subunit